MTDGTWTNQFRTVAWRRPSLMDRPRGAGAGRMVTNGHGACKAATWSAMESLLEARTGGGEGVVRPQIRVACVPDAISQARVREQAYDAIGEALWIVGNEHFLPVDHGKPGSAITGGHSWHSRPHGLEQLHAHAGSADDRCHHRQGAR